MTHRTAVEDLRASEAKYRSLIENTNDIIYSLTAGGLMTFVSPSWTRLVGHAKEEVEGHSFTEFVHPDDLPACFAFLKTVLDTGERQGDVEYRVRHRNGQWRWHSSSANPVRDASGAVTGFDGIARDITERKKQTEELEGFFTVNLDLLCIADLKGNFVKTNEAWSRILGYSTEELNGMRFLDFVHPDDLQDTLSAMSNLGKGENVLDFTNRYRCKDGSYRYIEWRSLPKGNMIYAAARDVTERKRMEDSLKASEASLRSVIVNSPVGFHIYHLEDDGRLVFSLFNASADVILHASHAQFIGLEILDAFPALAGTGIPEMYAGIARGDLEPRNFEAPYDHAGIRGVFEVRVFRGAPGQAVVNFVDITERKRAEEEILQIQRQLTAKNMELEQLVYVASHDLRSPLVNVDGFSRELEFSFKEIGVLLEDDAERGALENLLRAEIPDIHRAIARIRASARQMDGLLKALLSLSRSGRAALRIESVDMDELMLQVSSSFSFRIKEAGIDLSVGKLPPCTGDAVQLTQVFSNLLDNAIKYLDRERAGLITIRGSLEEGRAVYRVEDNGIGIADNHKEKIFELFHRLNPKSTEGEGLGLTLVRQILGRLDGEIRVESTIGKGSSFIVTLPAV